MKGKNTWARVFAGYLPKLILPLLVMMFVAMGIRINAYGITENRYLVMAGGMWTTGCMLYCAFKKHTLNINIVLSAAVIAALVVSGPWSCYAVSKYSQNARFAKILTQNNMLMNGKIVPAQEISSADKTSLTSIIQYFQRYHSVKELKLLPAGFEFNQMKEIFGFEMTFGGKHEYFSHNLKETGELQDIRGYDYFWPSPVQMPGGTAITQGSFDISYDSASRVLKISKEGLTVYQKDIAEVAIDIHTVNAGNNVLANRSMTYEDENEHLKIMILFRNINGTENGEDGRPRIEWLDFSVFIKLK